MKLSFKLLLVSMTPFFLIAQEASQDTTSLLEIIVTENRLQIPFNKHSRNVQIIDKQEIKNLPVSSINEVMTYLNGVDVRQRGAFGTQADISIDGGSFDQTLILINGVKVSDIQTGHHAMNIPINLDAIQRIEVLRGPAARIYGINALTGAINIITTAEGDNNVRVDIQSGTSFEKKEKGDGSGRYAGAIAQTTINFGTKKIRNLLGLAYSKTNGQRYNSQGENTKIYYQSRYKIDSTNVLNLQFGYIDNAFGANGYYAWPGDRESFEIVKSTLGSVEMHTKIGERFTLKPRLSFRNNKDDYRYYRNDLSIGRSEHETNVYALEINSMFHSYIGDFGIGLESRSEKINSTNLGDHQRYNHGIYAEYKTEAIDNFLVNTGAYINYNTQYGWQIFPGLDVSYTFWNQLKASFNMGSSQRLPSYTDLFVKQPKNIGNASLTPENAWQYEVSLRYLKEKSNLHIGYFSRRIHDFIDWVSDSPDLIFKAQNLGFNKVNGVYVGAEHVLHIQDNSHFNIRTSYTYLKPENRKYENGIVSKYVLESLKHQFITRIYYNTNNISAAWTNRWVKRELNSPYFISDSRLAYTLSKFKIYTDINNIFNQSYTEVGSILLPKRWYSLGLSWKLKE